MTIRRDRRETVRTLACRRRPALHPLLSRHARNRVEGEAVLSRGLRRTHRLVSITTALTTCTALLATVGCRDRETATHTWLPMGTVATVTFARSLPPERIEPAFTAVTSIVDELEQAMTLYTPDSELSRLNAAAGKALVPLSRPTRRTLRQSLRYAARSGGAFDPTVAPLVHLWGFNQGTPPDVPPSPEQIQAVRRITGYTNLVVSGSTAGLTRPGMRVDLGGIAKGYAVDRAFDILVQRDIDHFMVDIGGNLRVRGTSRPDKPWTIGVRDPFTRGHILGSLQLPSGMAVATSGNYERFVTIQGRRYAHIIDPRSGTPVRGMAGVTVLGPSAAQADALSTALFVLGPEEGIPVLRELPDCHALFIPDRQPPRILLTTGMQAFFTPRANIACRSLP